MSSVLQAGPHDIYRVADAVGSRHAYKARHSRRTPPRPRFARFRTASFKYLRCQLLVKPSLRRKRRRSSTAVQQERKTRKHWPNDECRTWQASRYYSPRSLIVKTASVCPRFALIADLGFFAVEASTVTNVVVWSNAGWDLDGCGGGECDPRLTRMRGGGRENCCFRKARVRCFFPVGPRGRLVIIDCYCCACFLHLTPRKLGIPMGRFVLMGPSTYFLRSFIS